MLTLLLASLFVLALNTKPVAADFLIFPSYPSGVVELVHWTGDDFKNYVNVTLSFLEQTITHSMDGGWMVEEIRHSFTSWDWLIIQDNEILAFCSCWEMWWDWYPDYDPGDYSYMIYESHTIDLGYLEYGTYTFTLYNWYSPLKSISFTVAPPPPIGAAVDIDPDTLNLKSNGEWVTAYIELPEGYSVSDIDVNSILLNSTIPVDAETPITVGDYDSDNIPDLMVKFDRATIIAWLGTFDYDVDTGEYYEIDLTVTGAVIGGYTFSGTETIRVLK